ncbi:hypothetical protein [Paraliomyxa miuraensis]|uniref:hypothetical protein n=1 Tax=Paraliomyxa miuraensis TaxID=376150 RepID=UPI0022525A22|nr:hypothetical protein [Paraliomyxa miuraensis]MCX4240669.1 hypothetical protein [Paraliomyxa miuraensis]
MAVVLACAGGGSPGGSQGSAFDPTHGDGTETDDPPATSTTTSDDGVSSVASAEGTGTAPPDASCCQVAPTPGCGNPQTESCVCAIQTSCCQSVWNQDCVDLAMTCNDPACPGGPTTGDPTGEPGDSSGDPPPPMLTCDQLAAQEGWMYWRCQSGGGSQCNGMGTPTTDCTFCCEFCGQAGDVSCGDYANGQGWGAANCEWNGNGACGGMGTPTCDCNFCCQVG